VEKAAAAADITVATALLLLVQAILGMELEAQTKQLREQEPEDATAVGMVMEERVTVRRIIPAAVPMQLGATMLILQ